MAQLCQEVTGFEGFAFIGDLHITSRRPGRRMDDYASACLDKLSQIARICHERNLIPICLGDLFHRAQENDIELLSRLMTVAREFPRTMGVLSGSHDHAESWVTERDAINLMAKAGFIWVMDQPGKVLTLVTKAGKRVNLWATPAGVPVPSQVDSAEGEENIMITHHDFDFNGKYPGSAELQEIENCGLMVNGHMHTPAKSVLKGRTACHNPGSTMRVSVDLKNHKPVVSVWTPAHGLSLEAVPLRVSDNVFDLTGKEVYAAEPKELKASLAKGLSLSSFASKLKAKEALEANRTDDGSVMVEELNDYFKMFQKSDNLKRYLTGLLKEVIEEKAEQ